MPMRRRLPRRLRLLAMTWKREARMAKWECLTEQESAMVRGLGHEPGPMVVNRIGEGHWMFLNMKNRDELLVSTRPDGTLRATVEVAGITPPVRTG